MVRLRHFHVDSNCNIRYEYHRDEPKTCISNDVIKEMETKEDCKWDESVQMDQNQVDQIR